MSSPRPMPIPAWTWRAKPVRSHDGDSITVFVDRGRRDYSEWTLRLLDAWCPELNEPGGVDAAAFTATWLAYANHAGAPYPLVLATTKPDGFGRMLAHVWRMIDGRCLNDDLVTSSNATRTKAG